MSDTANDFSKGSIVSNIMKLAVPMTMAQLINVLYNIIDRIYIGRIPENATLALTGLGLCLPIISMVIAFANLFGMGGAPLCSIERGRGNKEEAELIMGNSFVLMVIFGIGLTVVGLALKKPMLYLFGASDNTYPYADQYISIYLLGSIFVMIGLGMNSFINSQGFGTIGMMTVLLGAVANIILDPVFIFTFHMGVRGAALATILSQFLSALWIVKFLTGRKAILRLKTSAFRLKKERVKNIVALGMSGFTMAITNSSVQIMYNASLQHYGGDLYVGIMTVINSVREIISMPVNGLTNSAQPVMGFNYGAGEYKRVKRAIVFISVVSIAYTTVMWLFVHGFPEFFIRIFNQDADLVREGIPATFVLMVIFGIGLTVVGLALKKPMLYLFGASDNTYPYADQYISIYLLGSIFVMIGLGMNSFINSQGFGTIGMMTVLLGAVANIILDPVFIFTFHMGVRGAALATILSQFLSALWIVKFLTGRKAILRLKTSAFRLKKERVKNIVALGMSGFTMAITNSSVQIMYNASLQHYGGDLYVGIMTVINSVREIISMPVNGLTNSAQPVMGFNYGAGEYKRVKRAIVFISVVSIAYTTVMWLFVHGFPEFFIRIFNQDADLVREGIPAMRIYYFGFFMMSLQFAGQSVFVALGKAKNAVFFSIFRKVIIVIPLMLVLPLMFGLGTDGVLMAEPVSNFIGGAACFITMLITVWPELSGKKK